MKSFTPWALVSPHTILYCESKSAETHHPATTKNNLVIYIPFIIFDLKNSSAIKHVQVARVGTSEEHKKQNTPMFFQYFLGKDKKLSL